MKNEITFIIPSVNRPTLDSSVNSLLGQTNPNWKCIIIYDGVSGKTYDDNRIQVINSEKIGLFGERNGQSGLVRNKGLSLAKTEWVGFLDDDDTLHPDYTKLLFEKYYNYDFVIWKMKYPNGLVLPILYDNPIRFGNVGISFSFKNKYSGLFFDSNRDGEDFDFVLKLKNKTENYTVSDEIAYFIRH